MRRAITHLKSCDPIIASVIEQVGPLKVPHRDPDFATLARAIVFQQLNGKAATTIYNRLLEAAGGELTPESVRQLSVGEMRRVGLSKQKLGYLRDLAEHAAAGNPDFSALPSMSDEEVIAALTQIKGIGVWTAQMFLMFALNRPNVLPVADYGIRAAMKKAYRMRALPKPVRMQKIARKWHPYCTLACLYLWRSLDQKLPEAPAK